MFSLNHYYDITDVWPHVAFVMTPVCQVSRGIDESDTSGLSIFQCAASSHQSLSPGTDFSGIPHLQVAPQSP